MTATTCNTGTAVGDTKISVFCGTCADRTCVDGNQVFLTDGTSALCGVIGYSHQSVNIAAWADGGVHTLEFHSITFGNGTTNFFVDDVEILSGDVLCVVEADLDIKPGSCPNSFNRNSHGVLPVGLLGSPNFDVSDVDLASIQLCRADGVAGCVAPHEGPPGPHSVFDDVASPFDGATCDCHELTGDGLTDLSMKFKTAEVVSNLELDGVPAGALVELVVTGSLLDGTPFQASDCVRLVPSGTPPGLLAVQSNQPESWVDVSPLDLQLDGGGFGSFDRTWPLSTLVTFTTEETADGLRFVGWKLNGQFVSTALSIDRTVEGETGMVEAVYARAADLTGDGRVDLTDFAQFAICFGSNLADPAGPCSTEMLAASDLNRDGEISLFDFGLFASLFGR